MTGKEPDAFRTIGEVADELDLPQHVLRFWETKFSQIRPMKRSSGRRFYRPEDVALVRTIRDMLYGQGYTIRGVQRLLKERGARNVLAEAAGASLAAPPGGLDSDEVTQDVAPLAPAEKAASCRDVSPDFLERIRAVRHELKECVRILAQARAR